jgi:hypothetical protein
MTRITEPTPESGPQHPTFEVCIDEAGDDGLDCKCGEWMIISAFVSLRHHYGIDTKIIREIKSEIGWKEKKPLHFRDLPDRGKRLLVQRIADNGRRLRAISVLVHKASLDPGESAFYHEKHKLYFYLVRFLLERVSWMCRDSDSIKNRKIGDGTARIVFSAREDLSYDQLAAYFARLQEMQTSIHWSVIKPTQFKVLKNGKHPGLQFADCIASAMYCCEHHCERKKTADWAKVLRAAAYQHQGKYLGYGIKIFPPKAEKLMAQKALAVWAKEHFEV